MGKHTFKVETKPTLWNVELSSGSYSDYEESHYFIRANDREEAWFLFKEYWRTEYDDYQPCLVLVDSDERELERFAPFEYKARHEEDVRTEWDFDTGYGDAYQCKLEQLKVIEFKS